MAKALEDKEPESVDCECDVLKAWQNSEIVMRRLTQGMLVHLPNDAKKIKREHLGENVDLLAPILEHVGGSVRSEESEDDGIDIEEGGEEEELENDELVDEPVENPRFADPEARAAKTQLWSFVLFGAHRDSASTRHMPISPRSQAKAKKEHYLMKNKTWGYLCTLCGNHGMDPGEIKAKPCFPLPEVGSLGPTSPQKTPQKGVNGMCAEEQVLRAELVELEEQEKELALLIELQALHEQEAALLCQGLDEREAEAVQMATALSLSEAEARERTEAEEHPTAERVTHENTKLASTVSAENIAAEMLEMKVVAEPTAVATCSLIAVLLFVSVSLDNNDTLVYDVPFEFEAVSEHKAQAGSEAGVIAEAPADAKEDVRLVRCVPLNSGDEEREEEEEENDECVEPEAKALVVLGEEHHADEEEKEDPNEPLEEETHADEKEKEDPSEPLEEETRADEKEKEDPNVPLAATPGKETVHYDRDDVLPGCPISNDGPAMTAAEQVSLASGKNARGRGKGGRGKGRGRGRSRGRGGSRGGGNQHDEKDDAKDGEITPTEKEASSEDEPSDENAEPIPCSRPKAKARAKRSRSDSMEEEHEASKKKKAKTETRKRKRSPTITPKAKAGAKPKESTKQKAAAKPKASAKPEETAPKPKASAKASAKAKAKAKATPKTKAKAKAPAKSKAKAGASNDETERKASKSRKSVAYHKAMKEGQAQGKSEDECRAMAKAVFAGEGAVSKYWHEQGYTIASFDCLYGGPMDIQSNGGFALAMYVIMCEVPDAMNLLAPDCGSWVVTTRGRFIDKNGVARYSGNKEALKKSGRSLDLSQSDKELFLGMPIPESWEPVMMSFKEVGLGEAPAALSKNIATASSLDSYDSAVEDAQRREPKRVKETFVTPKKPLPADAAEAISARPASTPKTRAPAQVPVMWLRRYFEPKACGSLKCSEQALEMYKSEAGREQLRELLKKHGNFKSLEMNLRKFHLKKKILAKRGSYVTKAYLLGHCHWPMVEKAWVWANEHKVLRKNEVHGEEEAKLILSEDFDLLDEEGQEISMNGSVEMEDESGFLLKDDLPSVHASNADVLAGKITFPSLQQNTSPLAILAGLRDQIKESLKALKGFFKELQNKQADAINRAYNDSLLKLYANITKQDLVMNNLAVRARSIKGARSVAGVKPKPKKSPKKAGKKKKTATPAKGGKKARTDEDDTDDDLVDELYYGFEQGVDSAKRVVRVAQVASRALRKYGAVSTDLRTGCNSWGRGARLNQFPAGSGKGHDCSIVLGWLENLCLDIDITTIAPINQEIFKLLRWTLLAVNTYYRAGVVGAMRIGSVECQGLLEDATSG
ncbi:unnamed protein product [Symbiodinium sp. KB8]|nr:unnamed protein product [Symbiodinium sp. KB8]